MAFFRSARDAPPPAEGAPHPGNESERLTAVYRLRLLDTAPEERFDRVARLAAVALSAPVAFISLLDSSREWFKSVHGLEEWREIPWAQSFAAHALTGEMPQLVVPDAAKDPRFTRHPLVQGKNGIRFFAGQVLASGTGFKVGMLGVMDRRARKWSRSKQEALADLASLVEQELRGISLRDTAERLAEAERRAEEQHARFAAFMDHLPNVAFIKDAEGRTIFSNRHHEELFGIRSAEVQGKRDDEWLPLQVAVGTMAADAEVLATGRPQRIAEDIPTVLGQRHWLTFKFPVPTPSGERLLGGIAVDITAQKEAERRLQELLTLQNALVNSANVAIISAGEDGVIRTFNAAAERMLGYRADEVIGRARPEMWLDPAELRELAEQIQTATGEAIPPDVTALRWSLRHGTVAEHELTYIRKDGTKFHGALSITAMRNDGRIVGYMGVIQDITARRETEEAQRQAREAAEEASRAKSQFVANMSHEVRTPLNGILGLTAMLLETGLSGRQRELAELVLASGQGLLSIVNDVLDFSKIEAGRLELEAINFNLLDLLRSVSELNWLRAREKDLIIELDIDPEVPAQLYGDTVRLRQVLNNLLGNAIKFSERGRLRVAVRIDSAGDETIGLRFDVIDCGIGIPSDKLAHVFDPFTQADVSTTRLFGGTGLGLPICRQLVELMGGSIGVESEPGKGSDFWFTARFGRASASTPEADPPTEPIESLAGLRVLLAEDSAVNRFVAIHQLRKFGCDVTAVENGQQVLEATSNTHFDLILMDCQMPVLDGYATTAAIRAEEKSDGRHVRIIAVTANAMAGERERCLASGMDGYLAKPFKEEELHRGIQSVMRRTGRSDGSEGSGASPLDEKVVAALRKECEGGGGDLFAQYVDFFRDDIAQAETALESAEAASTADSLRRIAHRLRGAAANFGARPLMEICARIEKYGSAGRLPEATGLLLPLREQLARVREALPGKDGL